MHASLARTEVAYKLWHYTRAAGSVAEFNPAEAAAQWQQLLTALPPLRDVIAANNLPPAKSLGGC